jgi:hypothetical protein
VFPALGPWCCCRPSPLPAAERLGGAGAMKLGPLPDAMEPDIHCVRTHSNRGSWRSGLVRRIGSAGGCTGARVRAGARRRRGHDLGRDLYRSGPGCLSRTAAASPLRTVERVKGRMVKRAPVCHVLLALTAPITGSAVLRLLECYTAGGTIVKKPIWSCSPGWACDPIRSGSTARRVCGKLSSIGVINTIGLSRIRRIGSVPILERRTSQP